MLAKLLKFVTAATLECNIFKFRFNIFFNNAFFLRCFIGLFRGGKFYFNQLLQIRYNHWVGLVLREIEIEREIKFISSIYRRF